MADQKGDNNPNGLNLINSGTEISGDIVSNGDVRIDGKLRGTVQSRARLVIGQTGTVEGDIKAQHADISGQIKGNILVEGMLTLKASAKVYGDIVTSKLVVEAGADFNGKCSMKGAQGGNGPAPANSQHAKPQA